MNTMTNTDTAIDGKSNNVDLREAAETALTQCLNLGSEETCLIVTDNKREPVGNTLYAAASDITDDPVIIRYPPGPQHGEEPPEVVATALDAADVFLAPTTKSISHTDARGNACDHGARGATLPGITESVFVSGLDADYEAIAEHSKTLHQEVVDADEIRITSPQGTDITVEIGDREWLLDTGVVHDEGDFSNLPAGEIFISPVTATGTYVIDGTMRPYGLLDEHQQLSFEVEDGFITEISDEKIRQQVETAAEKAGQAAYNLAEVGIGTNIGVENLVGSVLLDEKAAGTVHLAIGDNSTIGGETEAPIHLDGILRDPTVYADGEKITLPQ